jgi:methionine synthase I (cobalamin-dependent)
LDWPLDRQLGRRLCGFRETRLSLNHGSPVNLGMIDGIQQLVSSGVILTDGAWGTELQRRGLSPGEFPDVWNLTHSDRVMEVARAYVTAGSRVILTNTFGANRLRLAEVGKQNAVAALNRRGVAISRQAAGNGVQVFASIGPTGRMLAAGDTTRAQLVDVFTEQAEALASEGPDALVIETMSDLEEGCAAVEAARTTGLPVVACMVFDSGKARDRTMTGVTPEQAAAGLRGAGADIIGANCGQGIGGFPAICRRLREATDCPIWIKANAGLPEWVEGRPVYRTTPEEFASYVPALRDAGAIFIGGCCGTTPDFIRAVAAQLKP